MEDKDRLKEVDKIISIVKTQIEKYKSWLFWAFMWANWPKEQKKEQKIYNRLKWDLKKLEKLKKKLKK